MRNILWTRDDSDAWTTECHQGPRGSIEAHLAKCFALAGLGGQRYDLGGYHSSLTSAHRAREVHQASRQHLHSRLEVVSRGFLSILDNYYWLVNTEPHRNVMGESIHWAFGRLTMLLNNLHAQFHHIFVTSCLCIDSGHFLKKAIFINGDFKNYQL